MKKVLMMVALVATMVLASCKPEVKTVPFLDNVKADYAELVAVHDSIIFYEAQIELDGNVSDRKAVNPLQYKEIFQGDTVVYFVERFVANDSVFNDSVNGYWMEDRPVNLDSICELNVAIEQLYKADLDLPESNLVTLRRPLYKVEYNPMYIFGSNLTFYVAVDAVTLEVTEFE